MIEETGQSRKLKKRRLAQIGAINSRTDERMQGYPDDYTAITYRGKPAADGPRYKALGNSMAVPVVRWLLMRIQAMERLNDMGQ